jgi:ATP/maltotriose-dependent transcriptional regulator MalT
MRMDPAGERRTGGPTTGGAAAGIVPAKVRAPRVRWLARERLDQLVPRLWQHRLTLVVAPAGSGKTTLLAAWAGLVDAPAAWYRAESVDGSERSLAAHLSAAFAAVMPDLGPAWGTVEEAAAALDRRPEARLLLVIDDLHALTGTPAEAALERFIDYAPLSLAVVAGTRVAPSFNLSRRRVAGEILELSGDDLRFRPWEVERLFRDFYGEALRPDELARLARRTEGWAAGLQLFHLATRGKAAAERQRLLAGLGPSSRLMREYLARNVVAELPDELREFLVGTCVLRRLTGSLCDRLLERHGSRALLEELERRSVFTRCCAATSRGSSSKRPARPRRGRTPSAAASFSRETGRSRRPSRPTAGPRTGPPSIDCWICTGNALRPARAPGWTRCPRRSWSRTRG